MAFAALTDKLMQIVKQLHEAVDKNDGSRLTELLNDNPSNALELYSVELRPYGSLLRHAAGAGNVEILKIVLDSGIDVNITQMDSHVTQGQTPLHIAALAGKHDIVDILLSRGADVNARESEGLTPLHCACSGNELKTVELLIKGGAGVNLLDSRSQSPLQRAILRSSNEIIKLLLQKNADIQIKDEGGQSVLHYAVEWQNEELVRLLIKKGISVNIQDNEGCSPLHLSDKDEIMQILIENGGDVNLRDNSGRPVISQQLDMEKEEYKRINALLEKSLQPPEIVSPSEDSVTEVRDRINKMVLPPTDDDKNQRSGVMAELLSKAKPPTDS